MKNIISLFLLNFFFLFTFGQTQFIGFKGGYSLTNISTNAFDVHETQPGFSIGITYDYETKNKITFGTEFLYESRGYKNEIIFTDNQGNPTGVKYPTPNHYNYFALPLKFGYKFGDKFFVLANIGVAPALLQKATITFPLFNYPSITYIGDTTVIFTNPSKFDISGFVEIGCGYQISNRFSVVSSFRYQYSFTSMTNDNYFKNYYINNYGTTLSLGIKYILPSKAKT
jgi:hypothetical protein